MEKTCEDKIASHLESRVQDFRVLNEVNGVFDKEELLGMDPYDLELAEALGVDVENAEYVSESAGDRIMEYPLGVSRHTVVRVELSWGGPQDYIEVHFDDERHIMKITYHFLDWFDGAFRVLSGPEFDIVAEFVERLGVLEYE